MGGDGGIFEIFQNGHMFLKFLFFKNIKKKKIPVGETPGFSFAAGTKRSMAHVPDRIGLLVLGSCC